MSPRPAPPIRHAPERGRSGGSRVTCLSASRCSLAVLAGGLRRPAIRPDRTVHDRWQCAGRVPGARGRRPRRLPRGPAERSRLGPSVHAGRSRHARDPRRRRDAVRRRDLGGGQRQRRRASPCSPIRAARPSSPPGWSSSTRPGRGPARRSKSVTAGDYAVVGPDQRSPDRRAQRRVVPDDRGLGAERTDRGRPRRQLDPRVETKEAHEVDRPGRDRRARDADRDPWSRKAAVTPDRCQRVARAVPPRRILDRC